jgi:putative ABC transport system substrate-binding protein
MKVDVIVTAATSASRAAKQATTTIPIVMASGSDPVRAGLVASLARPGGNITGLTTINVEVGGKRVELLKEAVPKLSRLAMLWQPGGPGNELQLREVEVASRALGLQLQPVGARVPNDFDAAFSAMSKQGVHAVVVAGNPKMPHGAHPEFGPASGRVPKPLPALAGRVRRGRHGSEESAPHLHATV